MRGLIAVGLLATVANAVIVEKLVRGKREVANARRFEDYIEAKRNYAKRESDYYTADYERYPTTESDYAAYDATTVPPYHREEYATDNYDRNPETTYVYPDYRTTYGPYYGKRAAEADKKYTKQDRRRRRV